VHHVARIVVGDPHRDGWSGVTSGAFARNSERSWTDAAKRLARRPTQDRRRGARRSLHVGAAARGVDDHRVGARGLETPRSSAATISRARAWSPPWALSAPQHPWPSGTTTSQPFPGEDARRRPVVGAEDHRLDAAREQGDPRPPRTLRPDVRRQRRAPRDAGAATAGAPPTLERPRQELDEAAPSDERLETAHLVESQGRGGQRQRAWVTEQEAEVEPAEEAACGRARPCVLDLGLRRLDEPAVGHPAGQTVSQARSRGRATGAAPSCR